jgi:hypothetical protein
MSLLSVCQNNERFTWDRLTESEEDHKNLQESFTKLNHRDGEMSEEVAQEKHITSMQSQSFRMIEGQDCVISTSHSRQHYAF